MKAKLYTIEIFNDSLGYVHGMGRMIWEIYIPEKGLVVNECGGCFKTDKPRSKGEITDIEINDDYAEMARFFAKSHKVFNKTNNLFFDRIKEKYKIEEPKKRIFPDTKITVTDGAPQVIDYKEATRRN